MHSCKWCDACKTVPVCTKVLNAFGGPVSPFGFGIFNFSQNYTRLTSDYANYFSVLSSINSANAGTSISELSTITANISQIYGVINDNPLFITPAPPNAPTCNPLASPNAQPYYCVPIGFCSSIPTDSFDVSSIQTILSNLQSEIPSQTEIVSLSVNSSKAAASIQNTYIKNKNGAAFIAMIALVSPQVSSIENKSGALLTRYNNATLSASISALKAQFSAVQSAGVSQNISSANKTLQKALANATSVYLKANASYNQVYAVSQQNTATLLAAQLSYKNVPAKLQFLQASRRT